jgi:hypothetical protein
MLESVDPEYRRPIVSNLLAQLIVLPFGALILDGGYIFHRLVAAALLYWISVPLVYFQLVIPSRACLVWLKVGFAMTLCAMFVMGSFITWWQG